MASSRDDRPASAREALQALGERAVPRVRPLRERVDRADLAALRLAIDAVRDGARRLLDLWVDRDAAGAMGVKPPRVRAAPGPAFRRVGGRGARGPCLGGEPLRPLLARGETRALVEEYLASTSTCPSVWWGISRCGIRRAVWSSSARPRATSLARRAGSRHSSRPPRCGRVSCWPSRRTLSGIPSCAACSTISSGAYVPPSPTAPGYCSCA
jgi:hypothetical protein